MSEQAESSYIRWPWSTPIERAPAGADGSPRRLVRCGSMFGLAMSDNRGMSALANPPIVRPHSKALGDAGLPLTPTEADLAALAEAHWTRGLAALKQTGLAERLVRVQLPPARWMHGRDGSLTARLAEGWLAGTGLPQAAAEQVMAEADVTKPALCLVAPTHGQQVRDVLDRVGPSQIIIALWADATSAAWAMRCVDLSQPIRDGKLWIVVGDDIPAAAEALRALFENQVGLVVPATLYRPGDAAMPEAEQLLVAARDALGVAHREREERMRAAAGPASEVAIEEHLLVIAPQQFRAWDDAPHRLRTLLDAGTEKVEAFDSDSPRQASLLALARAVRSARCIFSADTLRADFGEHLPSDRPWISWITRPRAPVRYRGGRDGVVLAEAAWVPRWVEMGWPMERLTIGEWPVSPMAEATSNEPVLIHDLADLTPPESVARYSTQKLLWQHLADDLLRIPFLLHEQESCEHLVRRRAELMGVIDVPVGRFVAGCVLPAYVRGIGRMLCRAGVHVRLFGRGWDEDPVTAPRAHGPVTSREQFDRICGEAPAVIFAHPATLPATAAGGPRLLLTGRHTEANFLPAVRRALTHPASLQEVELPLTAQKLMSLTTSLLATRDSAA